MQEAFTHRSEAFKRFLETSRQLEAQARKTFPSDALAETENLNGLFNIFWVCIVSWFHDFWKPGLFLSSFEGGPGSPGKSQKKGQGVQRRARRNARRAQGTLKQPKGFNLSLVSPPPVLLATSEASLGKFQGAYGRAGREAMETKGHWNSWGGFLMVLLLLPGPPGRPSHALLVRPWALGKPCSTISKDKIKNEKEHDV